MMKVENSAATYDHAIEKIAEYVFHFETPSKEAYETSVYCLADTLGCAILALGFSECTKLLGPVVPGTVVPGGSRVPGTDYILDPILAAFNIGTLVRWLDYNDTWLAAEWGHPSDNLGGILAISDYLSQKGDTSFTVKKLLKALIMAHEVQGSLALLNSFNRIGFDHVILVKVATAAVCTKLLGGSKEQIAAAISHAWVDVGPLRTYRHAPSTGSRKSWAAGDQTSRGLQFAWMVMQGEMGYPLALSAKKWGLYDTLFQGKPFAFERELGSYVMENVLFKISFPAEFHAQTAVECAIQLHPEITSRLDKVKEVLIETHESAVRIIDKKGPLNNPADRDHCLQYMVAIGLLFGHLKADHYEEETASDPRIDALREKMRVVEKKEYSRDYLDPSKRSIANAITLYYEDGTQSERIEVEYPIGHRLRREEGVPHLFSKLEDNLASRFPTEKVDQICNLFRDREHLEALPVHEFVSIFC